MTTIEKALRPTSLTGYVGQPALVADLRILIGAARARGETALPHVLLAGPPGLGKTTLAGIIAGEMKSHAHVAMGPGIEKPNDLFNLLARVKAGDVLFIDEIHRIPAPVAEYAYTAMEDGCIHIPVTMGERSQVVKIDLPPFTLIGATTQPELLEQPMRDRFGTSLSLSFYTAADLATILRANAVKLNVTVDDAALLLLASRARGTPRIANHLLRFARDVAQVNGDGRITLNVANEALKVRRIDSKGLNEADRQYLRTILTSYNGGPVGAEALAATIGCKPGTITGVVEPFILQSGLVARTQRGRCITDKGRAHMAAYDAENAPAELFAA